jgi:hypothetical protein
MCQRHELFGKRQTAGRRSIGSAASRGLRFGGGRYGGAARCEGQMLHRGVLSVGRVPICYDRVADVRCALPMGPGRSTRILWKQT